MPIKDFRAQFSRSMRNGEIYARREMLSNTIDGSWSTSFKGKGIEFSGFRQYQYGDDASIIDWRASLRSNETLVKEFEEYKNFSVFILLDVSNSMLFSSTRKLKCEFAAEMAFSLADAILQAGDAVGIGMFTDHLVQTVQPNIGPGVLDMVLQKLDDPNNYGGPFNIKKVLNETRSILKDRTVLLIISDFLGLEKGWDKYLSSMGAIFELLALIVRDPRDRTLPKHTGQYSLRDPYSEETAYIDVDTYAKAYEEHTKHEEEVIIRMFGNLKGGAVVIPTHQDYLSRLTYFLRSRQKTLI